MASSNGPGPAADAFGWQASDDEASAASRAAVRWRRRGSSAELRFAEPSRSRNWRRSPIPAKALPAASAIGWWGTTVLAHGGVMAGIFAVTVASGADFVGLGIGAVTGLVAAPLAGVAGYFAGRRRQASASAHELTEGEIAQAATRAFGGELRGTPAKVLARKAADAMRDGRPHVARVITPHGQQEFRIEAIDRTSVRVAPVESAVPITSPEHEGFATRFVRTVREAARPNGVTAGPDRRMAALERRLDAIERAGTIDRNHPCYPAFVLLYVDRLTEYRSLAARAEGIAELGTPEATARAAELARDLEQMVDLIAVGVDELEREVVDDSQRQSDEYLAFLREKYGRGGPGA